ncbi:MAG: sensor histidine kinase [Candidatus Dormibacteraceae bacterium]
MPGARTRILPGGGRMARWSSVAIRFVGRATGVGGEPPGEGWPRAAWAALSLTLVVALALTVVWAITGAGHFWPGWIWIGVLLPAAAAWTARLALRSTFRPWLVLQAAVSLVVAAALVPAWLLAGYDYFWPIWPILGLAVLLAAHAILVPSGRNRRERELAQRVDVLTRTRRDALDVQVAEMRRVERDLHDGAQARLVSLGMSLGMADELLDSDPAEVHRMLADARTAAGDALGELRALVRGILPPVLADRGLAGAVEALVLATPIPVELTVELPDERLPAPVESAAYFAIAEALANVVKHSEARSARVRICHANGVLSMVVDDDGGGGATQRQGSGLQGIGRRLAAFDGTMQISSPPGGPTVVTMEMPCEQSSPKT